jgi:hypothetical protein
MKVHSFVDIITNSSSVIYTSPVSNAEERIDSLVTKILSIGENFTVRKCVSEDLASELRKGWTDFYHETSDEDSWTEEDWVREIEEEAKYREENMGDWDHSYDGPYTYYVEGNGESIDVMTFLNLFNIDANYDG